MSSKDLGGRASPYREASVRRLDETLPAVDGPRTTPQVLTGRLPIAVEISTAISSSPTSAKFRTGHPHSL